MVRRAALGLVLLALQAAPGAAQCRLALVLGFDVSASVDEHEYRLMMAGTAAALTARPVQAALFGGPPVALAAYVWAGAREQAIIAPWALIDSPEALGVFADRLTAQRRPSGDPIGNWSGRTAVGAALAAGGWLLARAPECDAKTLDLVGDGVSNDGPETAPLAGITVNGLTVGGDLPLDHEGAAGSLSAWFTAQVIQGPGAFVISAHGYDDFAEAMQRKLLRELVPPLMGLRGWPGPTRS